MSKFIYSCPYCGEIVHKAFSICTCCHSEIIPIKSKYDYDYYKKKSFEECGNQSKWSDYIEEEVKQNPLFDKEKAILNTPEHNFGRYTNNTTNNTQSKNVPKCPTCGSTKISKISGMKRAAHGLTFGLFSKTARSQFECKKCGYKW
ncbi:MAG: transposase [Ruminococcus sp.]|nr:transposase [Ruminococcus sp.]